MYQLHLLKLIEYTELFESSKYEADNTDVIVSLFRTLSAGLSWARDDGEVFLQ